MYLRRSSEFKWLIPQGIVIVLLLFIFFACGTDSNESSATESNELLQQVTPSERLFTHDDVDATGFKTSKQYDVEGLTGATDVLFGFWRPDGSEAKEYEIRFYPSHDVAVESGTAFAEEATGDDAILDKDEASWNEGIKDRRAFKDDYRRRLNEMPLSKRQAEEVIDEANRVFGLNQGIFEPKATPEQTAALERLETLLALIEGWVQTVVAEALGESVDDLGGARLKHLAQRCVFSGDVGGNCGQGTACAGVSNVREAQVLLDHFVHGSPAEEPPRRAIRNPYRGHRRLYRGSGADPLPAGAGPQQ